MNEDGGRDTQATREKTRDTAQKKAGEEDDGFAASVAVRGF